MDETSSPIDGTFAFLMPDHFVTTDVIRRSTQTIARILDPLSHIYDDEAMRVYDGNMLFYHHHLLPKPSTTLRDDTSESTYSPTPIQIRPSVHLLELFLAQR